MYCQNKIVYTVQAGDSLYQLSRQFDTTVTELILGNPGVNPYNLQIGMRLNICPGENYDGPMPIPEMTRPGMGPMPGVNNQMPGGNQMPGMNNQMPGMNNQMPGMNNQMPGMNNQMPGMNNQMPGMNNQMPGMNNQMPEDDETSNDMENEIVDLFEDMRMSWLDLVFWNRMYLMAVDSNSKDQQQIEEQMLEAADDIVDVFAEHLPVEVTRQLRNLLVEHVKITGELIRTLKAGKTDEYNELIKQWYANANQMAELLGKQNPYFGSKETRNLLLNHLDMTREEIEQQMRGAYEESIDVFRDIRDQVLDMADYFTRGLLAR